ncbi:hypothetical protein TL16_g11696 [Triparma laevis f. inornata]|uniref:Uncharacterized protein n=1 Tax=Triparma laevis f. inornata TaxID=1714386 RepID=A0A9W7BGW3_9STRA|nr:hypothetical protein TL16_g11696 [Triparma laevis f. inornata]
MIPLILGVHTKFYNKLNAVLMKWLKSSPPPEYFTANFITYGRTMLLYPALFFWWCVGGADGGGRFFSLIVAMIVVLVDFGDFLDGVLARYWIEQKKKTKQNEDKNKNKSSPNPTNSCAQLNQSYGAYIEAVLDKAFVVPLWIYSISTLTFTSWLAVLISFTILFSLITIEGYSAFVRTRSYFLQNGGAPMEVVEEGGGEEEKTVGGEVEKFREVFMGGSLKRNGFSSSGGVKADSVGKCKQTLEMMGTVMFVGFGGGGRILGLFVLNLAVPMAYESVSRKVKKRVVLVGVDEKDHSKLVANLQLLNSVTTICSELWVACGKASAFSHVKGVDATIEQLPEKVDVDYLDDIGADFYLVEAGGEKLRDVEDDVFAAGRCIVVGKDSRGRITREKNKKE